MLPVKQRSFELSQIDRMVNLARRFFPERSIGDKDLASLSGPQVFFVDSNNGSANYNGVSPNRALTTLTAALALCVAARGDIIYLMPKHAETLTAAIAVNKAGVSIIGVGTGRNRPAFTNNPAATADLMAVSVANVYIENVLFKDSSLTSTDHINVTGADCEIANCEFIQGASDADSIILGAASQRAYIHDCDWRVSASGAARAISISSATTSDGIRLERLRGHGATVANTWTTAFISSTVAHLDCLITDVKVDFGMVISFTSATSTGAIHEAYGGNLGTAGNQIRIGGCSLFGGPREGYLLRIADAALPATGNATLGTATGGRVEIKDIVGQVGTIIQAQANAVLFVSHPAAGTDVNLAASVDINALEAGGYITFSNTGLLATGLVKSLAGAFAAARGSLSKVLASGAILRFNTAATNTGTMKFDIFWRPFDPGASLV